MRDCNLLPPLILPGLARSLPMLSVFMGKAAPLNHAGLRAICPVCPVCPVENA
jgi:hypothetical protein